MSNLEVHHREFRSHSGGDSEENSITLCTACHAIAHHRKPTTLVGRHGRWTAIAQFQPQLSKSIRQPLPLGSLRSVINVSRLSISTASPQIASVKCWQQIRHRVLRAPIPRMLPNDPLLHPDQPIPELPLKQSQRPPYECNQRRQEAVQHSEESQREGNSAQGEPQRCSVVGALRSEQLCRALGSARTLFLQLLPPRATRPTIGQTRPQSTNKIPNRHFIACHR